MAAVMAALFLHVENVVRRAVLTAPHPSSVRAELAVSSYGLLFLWAALSIWPLVLDLCLNGCKRAAAAFEGGQDKAVGNAQERAVRKVLAPWKQDLQACLCYKTELGRGHQLPAKELPCTCL